MKIENIINKAQDIASGWKNFIDKTEVNEKVAIERALICSKCKYAKKSMLLAFIKDDLKEVEGYYCSDCGGCPLSAKIRTKNNICKKWKN